MIGSNTWYISRIGNLLLVWFIGHWTPLFLPLPLSPTSRHLQLGSALKLFLTTTSLCLLTQGMQILPLSRTKVIDWYQVWFDQLDKGPKKTCLWIGISEVNEIDLDLSQGHKYKFINRLNHQNHTSMFVAKLASCYRWYMLFDSWETNMN